MEKMKQLIRTKTFWGGFVSIVSGVGLIAQEQTAEGIQLIVIGVLAIFGRDAVRKINT